MSSIVYKACCPTPTFDPNHVPDCYNGKPGTTTHVLLQTASEVIRDRAYPKLIEAIDWLVCPCDGEAPIVKRGIEHVRGCKKAEALTALGRSVVYSDAVPGWVS